MPEVIWLGTWNPILHRGIWAPICSRNNLKICKPANWQAYKKGKPYQMNREEHLLMLLTRTNYEFSIYNKNALVIYCQ